MIRRCSESMTEALTVHPNFYFIKYVCIIVQKQLHYFPAVGMMDIGGQGQFSEHVKLSTDLQMYLH